MDAFRNKGPNSTRTYTAAFAKHLVNGVTIASFTVGIDNHKDSTVIDPNPSAMLNGAAQKNSADFTTDDGVFIPANSGILQSLLGGVIGCTYVLTFRAVLSNAMVASQAPVWQVKLFLSQYEPDPFT